MSPPPAIVIAAGGDGRRIGGGKPLRLLGGLTLLDRAIAFAAAQSDCIAIAARDAQQVGNVPCPVLCDAVPGLGPIAALASGFRFATQQGRSPMMLIGCDQPFLPDNLVVTLAEALEGHAVAMPVADSRVQPLAALWHVDEEALAQYIAGGGRSLWRFAEERGVRHVEWPASRCDPFANVNTAESLALAEMRLSGRVACD